MKRNLILAALAAFSLSGCSGMMNWFDSVGQHMPVIGERCEHWQCFTESGKLASDQNKIENKQTAKRKAINAAGDQNQPAPQTQSAAPVPAAASSPADERKPSQWQPSTSPQTPPPVPAEPEGDSSPN